MQPRRLESRPGRGEAARQLRRLHRRGDADRMVGGHQRGGRLRGQRGGALLGRARRREQRLDRRCSHGSRRARRSARGCSRSAHRRRHRPRRPGRRRRRRGASTRPRGCAATRPGRAALPRHRPRRPRCHSPAPAQCGAMLSGSAARAARCSGDPPVQQPGDRQRAPRQRVASKIRSWAKTPSRSTCAVSSSRQGSAMSSGCASSTAAASSALNSGPASAATRARRSASLVSWPRRRSTSAPTVTGCGRRPPALERRRRRPRAPGPSASRARTSGCRRCGAAAPAPAARRQLGQADRLDQGGELRQVERLQHAGLEAGRPPRARRAAARRRHRPRPDAARSPSAAQRAPPTARSDCRNSTLASSAKCRSSTTSACRPWATAHRPGSRRPRDAAAAAAPAPASATARAELGQHQRQRLVARRLRSQRDAAASTARSRRASTA